MLLAFPVFPVLPRLFAMCFLLCDVCFVIPVCPGCYMSLFSSSSMRRRQVCRGTAMGSLCSKVRIAPTYVLWVYAIVASDINVDGSCTF